jgi:hypothetical protein
MPKQKRWNLKRELDRACSNISNAQIHIVKVGEEFRPFHPEYTEALQTIFTACETVKEHIEKVRDLI